METRARRRCPATLRELLTVLPALGLYCLFRLGLLRSCLFRACLRALSHAAGHDLGPAPHAVGRELGVALHGVARELCVDSAGAASVSAPPVPALPVAAPRPSAPAVSAPRGTASPVPAPRPLDLLAGWPALRRPMWPIVRKAKP